ncbi:hypothetical protein DESUT3_31600 [Desulfuromonas versatilis]|uniref:HTH tetR-type domain-containing protein n=1 Tax=Desulfuromonas versatilis TaxID=2802975 RepID=A0ABN6E185_9BACT|nr:TetR/AcrR family transcriptional regulator [Desulfuromonas versatilis]BCR06091.1 hypothetical protein DESUT3_31600 [Desulfuromonas versatilis]
MKKRQINPGEKRERVIGAARRLFVENGYHNVSIPQIVAASKVSTGAIYSYFPNKEKLAQHIHEQTLAYFQACFEARLVGKTTTYEKLRAFGELVYELAESEPDLMEYLLFMRHGEFMQEAPPICFTQPFHLLRRIIAEGIERGEVKNGDFFILGVSFTGAILRAVELRFCCVLEKPLTEIADSLIENAWAAIKA